MRPCTVVFLASLALTSVIGATVALAAPERAPTFPRCGSIEETSKLIARFEAVRGFQWFSANKDMYYLVADKKGLSMLAMQFAGKDVACVIAIGSPPQQIDPKAFGPAEGGDDEE